MRLVLGGERMDRLYVKGYRPQLQSEKSFLHFLPGRVRLANHFNRDGGEHYGGDREFDRAVRGDRRRRSSFSRRRTTRSWFPFGRAISVRDGTFDK